MNDWPSPRRRRCIASGRGEHRWAGLMGLTPGGRRCHIPCIDYSHAFSRWPSFSQSLPQRTRRSRIRVRRLRTGQTYRRLLDACARTRVGVRRQPGGQTRIPPSHLDDGPRHRPRATTLWGEPAHSRSDDHPGSAQALRLFYLRQKLSRLVSRCPCQTTSSRPVRTVRATAAGDVNGSESDTATPAAGSADSVSSACTGA